MLRVANMLGYYELPERLVAKATRLYEDKLLPEVAARMLREHYW